MADNIIPIDPADMTRQARAQAEYAEFSARISREYGMALGAQTRLMDFSEQDLNGNTYSGAKVIAVLTLTPVAGWQPPITPED